MTDKEKLEKANEVIRFLKEKPTGQVIDIISSSTAPVTQGKIKHLTGLSWSQVNRAVKRLEKYRLAEDQTAEGRSKYTLTYKLKGLYLLIEKIAFHAEEPIS